MNTTTQTGQPELKSLTILPGETKHEVGSTAEGGTVISRGALPNVTGDYENICLSKGDPCIGCAILSCRYRKEG